MSVRKRKTGLPPGSIVYTGKRQLEEASLISIVYDQDVYQEYVTNDEFVLPERSPNQNIWIDLKGLHNVELVKQLGKAFHVHHLTLEDITDIYARPKWGENEEGIFFIFKSLKFSTNSDQIATEQISIAFNENTLVTFQEDSDDTLNTIRERMKAGKGRIRVKKADYLAYVILDLLLDKLYITLDSVEDQLEVLESRILDNPRSEHKEQIYFLKRLLLVLRKNILPIREVIQTFERTQHPIIQPDTKVYIRDLSDHIITLSERVDTFREILFSIQELYASEMSIRMNRIIQWLTIITALFVPVTFVAGVWGMNFQHLPFTQPKYGFALIALTMFLMMLGMFFWFRRNKWM